MDLEFQILLAFLLDQIIGDPRWLPHPVKFIGDFASRSETIYRKLVNNKHAAGFLSVLSVLCATGITVIVLLYSSSRIHPLLGEIMSIFLLYTTIAAKDLTRHSRSVYGALQANDISEARTKVSMIVGRDTDTLEEEEITRATIESVAESMVDGVTAPLFFAMLGGPLAAMLYKAINTMDSMFGYKNDQYEKFGWAAAKLDDLVNFIPARLTGLLVPLAAFLLRLDCKNSYHILFRDRLNHSSPNSGHTEAAVAGALNIQLGGPSSYFGKIITKPTIGDAVKKNSPKEILITNWLMLFTSLIFLISYFGIRFIFNQKLFLIFH